MDLKINALLEECSFQGKWSTIEELKKIIMSVPTLTDVTMDEDLQVPIPVPHVLGRVHFTPPQAVHLVGSYDLGTCVRRPYLVADLLVEIPSTCIATKDFKDNRYFYRRLLYLSCIARHLRTLPIVRSVSWIRNGDKRRPLLELALRDKTGRPCLGRRVHIDTVLEDGAFRPLRFAPDRKNVQAATSLSTPSYNSAMIRELTAVQNHGFLVRTLSEWTAVRHAAVLLRVWLTQRRLKEQCGGVSGQLVDILCAHLVTTDQVASHSTSFQVFQQLLRFLSDSEVWAKQGLSLYREEEDTKICRPSIEQFRAVHPVVIVGPTGYDNLASTLWLSTLTWLAYEAKSSLTLLEKKSVDHYEAMFMVPHEPLEKFDHVIVIKDTSLLEPIVERFSLASQLADTCEDLLATTLPKLCHYLKEAFGDRLRGLMVDLVSIRMRLRDKSHPVLVCLQLNSELMENPLIRGPQCGSEEAKQFIAFWGEKAEMRHIDADLRECVLWDANTSVTLQMVDYVLFGLLGASKAGRKEHLSCHQVSSQLLPLLSLPRAVLPGGPTGQEPWTERDYYMELMRKTMSLAGILRGLSSQLPLDITGVRSISAAGRETSVFPPMPMTQEGRNKPRLYVPVHHLIVTIELSGKWPDDLEAFRQMKMLYLLRMLELLGEKDIQALCGKEGYLDVPYEGYMFRIHLAQPKESQLLRVHRESGSTIEMDSPLSRAWERFHVHLPHTCGVLGALSRRYPAYPLACRLAKRWLSSHLCPVLEPLQDMDQDRRMYEVALEMLVAAGFVTSHTYEETRSPVAGFLRFLRLLGHTDFQSKPVVIDINDQFSCTDDVEALVQEFSSHRSRLPALVLITPLDQEGALWTGQGPSRAGLDHLQRLARDSLQVLSSRLLAWTVKDDLKEVFRCDTSDLDMIVEVDPSLISRGHEAVDLGRFWSNRKAKKTLPKYAWSNVDNDKMMDVGLDTFAVLVTRLQAALKKTCSLFYDPHGGQWIGIRYEERGPPRTVSCEMSSGWKKHVLQDFSHEVQLTADRTDVLQIVSLVLGPCITKIQMVAK